MGKMEKFGSLGGYGMYKVLIVDDEKFVISLIEKLVDWETLDMEVVGSAGDGIQGIQMVERLKPDILIADVKMPGFDGISLIKKVREIDRDIKFIMISGHKRFEYAKSVMKYNVEDYLLKPIDKQELEEILSKIKKELDQRNVQRENENEMNKRWDTNKSLMNALFMEKLCSGQLFLGRTDLGNINSMYFTEFTSHVYQCVIIQLNGITNNVGTSFVEDFLQSVCTNVEKLFQKICCCALGFTEHHRITFLLEYGEGMEKEVRNTLFRAFAEGTNMASKYPGLKLAFGVGEKALIFEDILPLKEALKTTEKAVDARFRDGYDSVLFYSQARTVDGEELKDMPLMLEELRRDIRSASENVIFRRIESMYASAQKELNTNPALCTDLAELINNELYQYLRLFKETDDMQSGLYRKMKYKIEESTNVRELIGALTKHICECIDEIAGDSKGNLSPAIRTAKIFITSNYMNDISLNDVANVVNLSSVYFSGLFKKEIGENFVDYLNRVRIDAAKVMLKDIRYNVSEIAGRCGFSDTRYFARIFKRIVGITPSDYRKRQAE